MTVGWPLSRVELNVGNLRASADFYRRLGFTEIASTGSQSRLGTGGRVLLVLHSGPNLRTRQPPVAGLYHFAILIPSLADLAQFADHGQNLGLRLTGASDHLVSRSLYFKDVDGNGIEVYADRSRDTWEWNDGRVSMTSIPLDSVALAAGSEGAWTGFPADTLLGHVHLRVSDLDRSQIWYEGLGMAVTASIPGARFLSWDGYHHHLGLNVWEGAGVGRLDEGVEGLARFVARLDGRHRDALDPDGIPLTFECAEEMEG